MELFKLYSKEKANFFLNMLSPDNAYIRFAFYRKSPYLVYIYIRLYKRP